MTLLLSPGIGEAFKSIVFEALPPAVTAGMTRYWALSASEISDTDKDGWNAAGVRNGYSFSSSSANPTVSVDHYTGFYWNTAPLRFGAAGVLESNYPGRTTGSSLRFQNLSYVWQTGGVAPDYHPSALFTNFGVASNSIARAKNRHFHAGVRYKYGFDFVTNGLDGPDFPNRVTMCKIKPYFDDGDIFNNDSCPTIGLGVTGAAPNDTIIRVTAQGDSDLLTPDIPSLEYNDKFVSTMVIRDHQIYRIRAEVLYDVSDLGQLFVWISENGGPEEQIVNEPSRTTYLNTTHTTAGDLVATRNPYIGAYISGSGHNVGTLNIKFDNIYFDRDTPV